MEEYVYLNGSVLPRSEAAISPFTHGFLYGFGLFETVRAYGGRIFRLDRHLARLQRNADALGLTGGLLSLDLEQACYSVLKANSVTDARLRLTVAAGEGEAAPDPSALARPTVFIFASDLPPFLEETYEKGYAAIISTIRRNSTSPITRLKTTSWLENYLARLETRNARADEALFLNELGFLTEGSITNVFLVIGGGLMTPVLESGALGGITREVILELAETAGISVTERKVGPEELVKAEEAFISNSVIEIMPLTLLNNKPIGAGKPGPVTRRLMADYRQTVEKETGQRRESRSRP